jgi:hypothetical protein
VKFQEGKIGRQNINRVLGTQIDSHA